jgi:dipeptidyl aminopeptidase/acylaminoacyl peptidase
MWQLLLLPLLAFGLSMSNTIKQQAPYGSWQSPISAHMVAESSVAFQEIALVNDTLYWLEARPSEGGRVALVSWNEKEGEKELLPKEYSVRTRVHEYGGGALLVTKNGIYFIRDQDQQIYCLNNGVITQITSQANARFADGCISTQDSSLFYVMEEHGTEVVNSIVTIDPKTGAIIKIVSGNDFYSNPRISPDGNILAYITWNHPNMPWDGTELWLIDRLSRHQIMVAGGNSESVADPKWSPDGKLHYVSDRNNWWTIYREKEQKPIIEIEAEFALPPWSFGKSLFGFSGNDLVCSYVIKGVHHFAKRGQDDIIVPLGLPYTTVKSVVVDQNYMGIIAGSWTEPLSIIMYDLKNQTSRVIKKRNSLSLDTEFLSQPQALEFPTAGGRTAHGFYYPPCHKHYSGLSDEKPPLIVHSHGGPTGHVSPTLSFDILYWTSRGFAVIDVNYGGSTGYGREYRERLKGTWGIVDVDDCSHAALYCAEQGLADRNRLAIKGGSAGGFTTLAALAFRDVFKVGANYYGVADLERLALDTHKFESRYLDQLIGPYPEAKALYHERSPIRSVDRITCPIIIFQGDEDAVVPPSQSEMMYKSLVERKIPTAYLLYKGEQHGFRKAPNIKRSLEAQLYFFAKILKIPLSEKIEPVEIANFEATCSDGECS